jgi:hypothetical protein
MQDNGLDLDLSRRSFLKLGLGAGVALSLVGVGATLSSCGKRAQAAARGYRFLRDADLVMLTAVMPVVLAGLPALDARQTENGLRQLDELLIRADTPVQSEVRKLFDLLDFGLTRWLVAGVRKPWNQAAPAEIEAFLQRWRASSIGLLNYGYRGVVKLCAVPYFGQPAGYKVAGYPGPLDWMYKAINA